MVIMYTDGASRGNPGPGGYGVVLKYGEHRKELSEASGLRSHILRLTWCCVPWGATQPKHIKADVVVSLVLCLVVWATQPKHSNDDRVLRLGVWPTQPK